MYNLDELVAEDLKHMNQYIGELVFFNKKELDNEPHVFLKSLNNGEVVIYSVNINEIREIFSEQLFEVAKRETLLLNFYADIDEDNVLYNIKELTVYHKYYPWHK